MSNLIDRCLLNDYFVIFSAYTVICREIKDIATMCNADCSILYNELNAGLLPGGV